MSKVPQQDEDELRIIEDIDSAPVNVGPTWRILIVDDDEEVHQGTIFALKDEIVLGRRLEFAHAYTAIQAIELLAVDCAFAIILLDVVMESTDAGLGLVKHLRGELGLTEPRIILRTGQPGYAPESSAIRLYDINDYRSKSELTHARLLTSITAAMRAYEQIHSLAQQRVGLQRIIDAAVALSDTGAVGAFAEGVILQIGNLLHIPPDGILCVQSASGNTDEGLQIIGAAGRFLSQVGCDIDQFPEPRIAELVRRCVSERNSLFLADATVLFIPVDDKCASAVFVDTSQPVSRLDVQLLTVFCSNISGGMRNVRLLEELRGLAFFDSVSQLPNRVHFLIQLDAAIAADDPGMAVVIVDIDHFSEINDVLGHQTGDTLLREMGVRLREFFPGIPLARIAGDHFALLTKAQSIAPDLIATICDKPFQLPEVEVPVSITAGLAFLRDVHGGSAEVLKSASLALKQAKSHSVRGRCEYYNHDMDELPHRRLAIYRELRQALLDKVLTVYYQPQISLSSGHLIGVEALIRWRKNDGSFLPPDSFIPVAESTGLIISLGEFVFAEACCQLQRWQGSSLSGLRMAVNVSMAQLLNPHFLAFIKATLQETGVSPEQLEVEVTESMLMTDAEMTIQRLDAIRALGIAIAIDDFGTGFSSLAYLQRLPIDRLKVDRSFVKDLGSGGRGATIAHMVVQLGKTLNLSIIGEGIETAEQENMLMEWGCHEGQGFLYSPALRPDELAAWRALRC